MPGLQQLWTEFRDRGLTIIGVPSNDFGGQEPGGAGRDREHRTAALWGYLPNRGKSRREGPECASLLQMGCRGAPKGCPALEFPQVPCCRDGYIAEVFPESVDPSDTRIKTAIARALADS